MACTNTVDLKDVKEKCIYLFLQVAWLFFLSFLPYFIINLSPTDLNDACFNQFCKKLVLFVTIQTLRPNLSAIFNLQTLQREFGINFKTFLIVFMSA